MSEFDNSNPFYERRSFGGLLLLVGAIFCLMMVLLLDATVFVPFNATQAVTQTWQAENPPTSTRSPQSTDTPEPDSLPTERF